MELTTKRGRFSKAEIAFIIEEGAKYGILPPRKTDCVNCWRDMAIEVAVASRPRHKGVRLRGDAAKYGVVFKGRTITNATLDDATLQWMREEGFPEQLLEP